MTLTLISDIISRKIVSRAYLQQNVRDRNPIVRACVRACVRVCVCVCVCASWEGGVWHTIFGQSVLVDLDL